MMYEIHLRKISDKLHAYYAYYYLLFGKYLTKYKARV